MSGTTNHDLHFDSEDHTNELADGELDERDLEVINGGGCPPPPKPEPGPGSNDDALDKMREIIQKRPITPLFFGRFR